MIVFIDPEGMYNGERLAACSDHAKLLWPHIFVMQNGYGRFELNLRRIQTRCFAHFSKRPSEKEIESALREYAVKFLLLIYEADGQLWGQWDTPAKYLPRHKTSADKRSPEPSATDIQEFRATYIDSRVVSESSLQTFRKSSKKRGNIREVSEDIPTSVRAVAVAVAVADADAIAEEDQESPAAPLPRPQDFGNVWNRLIKQTPLPKVLQFTDSRRRKVQARISQGVTLEAFERAVKRCCVTPFLIGQNDRGWKATFDWLVDNDSNMAKVLEGTYESTGGNNGRNRAQTAVSSALAGTKAALARIDEMAGHGAGPLRADDGGADGPGRYAAITDGSGAV